MPAEVDNNKSAEPHSPLYDKVIILCVKISLLQCIISPFSVLEKPDGGVRLIHEGSQPVGDSFNEQATINTRYKFQTVDSAAFYSKIIIWPKLFKIPLYIS